MTKRQFPSLSRPARRERDDRIFVVATEDTYGPKQYFNALAFDRVRVQVLETTDNKSAPQAVVDRLCEFQKKLPHGDEYWIVIDTDHHFQPNHKQSTIQALNQARQRGFHIAVSNPCWEVWLLLHHIELTSPLPSASSAETLLRETLGGYSKHVFPTEKFSRAQLPEAIRRARNLAPDQVSYEANNPGTQVYQLLEHILTPP